LPQGIFQGYTQRLYP